MKIFEYVPHPHIEFRKRHAPKPRAVRQGRVARFNAFLGESISKGVGTMWCAYTTLNLGIPFSHRCRQGRIDTYLCYRHPQPPPLAMPRWLLDGC